MNNIYFIQCINYNFIITTENNFKNISIVEKYKYKCLDCDILKERLKNNLKNINIDGEIFKLTNKEFKKILIYFDKLIIDINNKIIKNTCDMCNFSTYRNDHFKIHLNSKKHIKNKNTISIKENKLEIEYNLLLEENKSLEKENNKLKTEYDKLETENTKLYKKIDKLKEKNKEHNNNLIKFTEEDLSILSDYEICYALTRIDFSIKHIVEIIHFNKKYPQYTNIYISNKKENEMHYYNGNKWMISGKINGTNTLFDIYDVFLTKKFRYYEELKENNELDITLQDILTDDIIKKYNKYLNNIDKYKKFILDSLKRTMYNNKHLIIKN